MNWFKSLWLTSEERRILKEAKEAKLKKVSEPVATVYKESILVPKPYSKLLYSGRNITVIFTDGDILSCSNIDMNTFELVKESSSKDAIYNILVGTDVKTEIETVEEKVLIKDNLKIFRESDDFNVNGTDVFLNGVNLAIPAAVLFSFIEIMEKLESAMDNKVNRDVYEEYEEQYTALKMFWIKLALNPLEQSREDLLIFIKNNNVRITKNGNLVLYRRIVSTGTSNKEVTTFVSQAYYDRKKQKKSHTHPRNYAVLRMDGVLQICHTSDEYPEGAEVLGNLLEMYQNLDKFSENTFTSSHNRGQMKIQVGSIYRIPDEEINLDNGNCAAGGLHAAAVDYDYSGFGDTPVVVLVNPSKAITVPRTETGKMRTTEMFIACVNNKPRGVHFDEDALSSFDEEYHDITLKELEEAVSSKSFTKVSIKENKPKVNMVDIAKMKDLLKTRVQIV